MVSLRLRAVPSSTTLDWENVLLNGPRNASLVMNEGQSVADQFVHLRPVAASPLRGHRRGHLPKPEIQNGCDNRYLEREFGASLSHFKNINKNNRLLYFINIIY
jgi:hypothetical protein